jgi:hypothetical protein
MIKVENNMLVLDSAFTKEDVLAINHFVEIAKKQERERIIKLLEDTLVDELYAAMVIAIIKGEQF